MAFCNSCGANLNPGTRFCSKCGAAVLASTLPPVSSAPSSTGSSANVPAPPPSVTAPPPAQSGGALKVILIVLGVLVLVVVLAVGAIGIFAWRVAKHSHVKNQNGSVTVETPFGTVNSDPDEAVRNLGVDVYPGARAEKMGASSATVMGMHTATVQFDSDDPLTQVSAFYKSRFPNANVSSCDQDHCNIVATNDQRGTVTINMHSSGSGTRFQITSVSKKN